MNRNEKVNFPGLKRKIDARQGIVNLLHFHVQ